MSSFFFVRLHKMAVYVLIMDSDSVSFLLWSDIYF